jgi:hypothetical protein
MEVAARYPDFWAERRTGQSFRPGRVRAGEHAAWVLDQWLAVLVGVDPITQSPGEPIQLPRPPRGRLDTSDLATGEGAVWALWPDGLVKVDERTGSPTAITVPVHGGLHQVVVGAGAALVLGGGRIARVDARSGNADVFEEEVAGGRSLGFGHGHLWVLAVPDPAAGQSLLSRYSTRLGDRPAQVVIDGSLSGIAFGQDSVWIHCIRWEDPGFRRQHRFLIHVDPATLELTEHEISAEETWFAVGSELWFGPHTLPSPDPPVLTEIRRVNPSTWEDIGVVRVPGLLSSLSLGPSGIWGLLDMPRDSIRRVCRVDPDANEVAAALTLEDVDARPFLPPPPGPIVPGPVERRLRDELAQALLERAPSAPRQGQGTTLESVLFEDVRLEGAFPNTEVVILFRTSYRPEVRFGRRERIWSDAGVYEADGSAVILENLEESIIFKPGLPFDDEPDPTGVVWI